MPFTRAVAAAAVVVAFAAAACVPPEPAVPPLARDYDPILPMGAIQRDGVLRVGVPNVYPWASGPEDDLDGFAVQLGEVIARPLGVEIELTRAASHRLIEMVKDGDLDVAFPATVVTERRARRNTISDPYFVAHQRLFAPDGIDSVEDLSGLRVCSLVRPQTEVRVHRLNPDATALDECSLSHDPERVPDDAFSNGPERLSWWGLAWDAATGLDIRLVDLANRLLGLCPDPPHAFGEADDGPDERDEEEGADPPAQDQDGFCVPPRPEIRGDALSTGGIGAFVSEGSPQWLSFVDSALMEAKRDGVWTELYEEWITPYLGPPPDPPVMTIEEAAALFPSQR